jgi:hypothetical protein
MELFPGGASNYTGHSNATIAVGFSIVEEIPSLLVLPAFQGGEPFFGKDSRESVIFFHFDCFKN